MTSIMLPVSCEDHYTEYVLADEPLPDGRYAVRALYCGVCDVMHVAEEYKEEKV